MNSIELLRLQLMQMHDEIVHKTLADLTIEQLNWRPNAEANNIGFSVWHALRVWDFDHARMGAGEELYEREHWPKRFGFEMAGNGMRGYGIGSGFSAQDIAGMHFVPVVLATYADALWARTQQYLDGTGEADLDREFLHPWRPEVTLTPAKVLVHTITHTAMHIGEAAYVRGLMPRG